MAARVFISHSSKDGKIAQTICSALESRGLPCWIAGRDVGPGENFMEAIVEAIGAAKVMVMVFSENANNSDEIKREMVLAGNANVTVIPVRVENVVPKGAFAYQLATRQWIDLFDDWESQIERLATRIGRIVPTEAAASAAVGAEIKAQTRPDAPVHAAGQVPAQQTKVSAEAEGETPATAAVAQRLAEEAQDLSQAQREQADAKQQVDASTRCYYLDGARNQQGPVSLADIAHFIRGGTITRETLIWHPGMPDWRPVGLVNEFASLFAPSPPPIRPPMPPTGAAAARPPAPQPPPSVAPPGQAAWAQAPVGKSYKRMAIGALVCGIISLLIAGFIVGPIGVILGVIARKGMRESNNRDGYGLALGGIIIGAIGAVLAVLIILVAIGHR